MLTSHGCAMRCRYSKQYDSLVKVETEQRAMIEKLSNNEAQ